jgi:hypothetical protein
MSNGIYSRGQQRDWSKPAVYKITPNGMWWATYRDQHGKYHTDCFHEHYEALSKAYKYAAGSYE